MSAAFHHLDPSRYPATVAVADELPVPLEEEFTFGLRLIVAGLKRLQGSPHPEALRCSIMVSTAASERGGVTADLAE